MKESFRDNILRVVQTMEYQPVSNKRVVFLMSSSRSKRSMFLLFDELEIKYSIIKGKTKHEYWYKLVSPYREVYTKISDHEDNLLSSKYDYTELISTLKQKELTKKDICGILKCRPKDYVNIITYLSRKYPIYEDDEENIGLLVS